MENKKTDNWNHWWKKTRSSRWGKHYFTVGDVKQMFNIWQNQKKSLLLQIEKLEQENKEQKEHLEYLDSVGIIELNHTL